MRIGQGHLAHASTLTVSDCTGENGTGQIGQVIGLANAGNTINFSCNGTIPLTSTLTISKDLHIDGSGQSVTLDGGGTKQVLHVNSGVTFTLNALTIAHGNSCTGGGGLGNLGTVTITNSTFANNITCSQGGGLENFGGSNATITNSTFFANSAASDSGGLGNLGTVTITNSTFANNSANGGGGLGNFGGSNATITNSTFANNSAVSVFGGGLINAGSLTLSQSIVANNTGGDCDLTSPFTDLTSPLTDNGYNLDSDGTCGLTMANHDLPNTNPQLGPLADNGGPTQTLALLPGSSANDTIPSARCPSTDQRGVSRPDNGETTCDMGAYEFVDPPDHDLALTNVPANITTNATGPQGAVVTYTAPTVVDEDSPLPTVSCTPASGSTFAIGTTKVTCTATDSDDTNSPVSASFTVTVNDIDLGLKNLPANITSDATSPQGAIVSYTPPTAVDEDSPLPTVSCTLASGSVFPIGTTIVKCTVTDTDDTPNSVSASFTVTVKGAAAQVSDLIHLVNSFGLPAAFQASFDTQLQAVQTDLTNNKTTQACRDLTAFINHVKSQSGKGLTTAQANLLIPAAKRIQAVLGC